MSRFANEWTSCPVARSTADWGRLGVGRGTLRGGRYDRTAPGFHRGVVDPHRAPSSTQRILDAKAAMPDGALIAGWAAAYVHGIDALDGLDDVTLAPLPVPVLLPPGHHRADSVGIRYLQSRRLAQGVVVEDVPVTSLLRTAFDLTRLAPDLTESVVVLDAFLGARRVKPDTLHRAVERLTGRRGVRQARRAVELARVGVRSTWETRLRMFALLEVGLTDLEPNRAVFGRAGELIGIPDLLAVDAGLALEYDGATWRSARAAGHRDREQHREDNAREERLERAGLIVVRAEKSDLIRHRAALADRIRSAHADGLTRDRTRDRWTLDEPTGWYGLPA